MSDTNQLADKSQRFSARRPLHELEQFAVAATFDGSLVSLPALDVTPFGALVSFASLPMLPAENSILESPQILHHGKVVGGYTHARVARVLSDAKQCGIEFDIERPRTTRDGNVVEMRSAHRVVLDSMFAPQAWCSHPLQFDHHLSFRVANVSLAGAQLICSARNKLLFRGMELTGLRLLLPTVGELQTDATIISIAASSEDNALVLGVRFESSAHVRRAITRFALAFAPTGARLMSQLRQDGTPLKAVKDVVDFQYVHATEHHQEVLELRREAYVRAEKVPSNVSAADMQDSFDKNSVIVAARSGQRVVGSVRVTYCKEDTHSFELDASGVVPASLPRNKTIEVSRLCVSSEFEGSNLVLGLIERAVEIGLKLGVEWVITSATEDKISYYKQIGFKPAGVAFELKTLHGVPHQLLVLDVEHVVKSAKGLHPLAWMFAFGRVVAHLASFGVVESRSMPWWKRLNLLVGQTLLKLRKRGT